MRTIRRFGALVFGLALAGCSDDQPTLAPEAVGSPSLAKSGVAASATGSGSHLRAGTEGPELTTFAFSAVRRAGGTTTGQWRYDFRAAGFSMHGDVTCLSIAGAEAWVGGTVQKVTSSDPAIQALLGVDMWWRSRDNGEGAGSPPDSTTGLGFKFPMTVITAESWCRDQPELLVLREVEVGNIQVQGE
jgi:hypothetical protein